MDARLLLIDPQEDFCNPQWGTLYVPGADQDMLRVANMIGRVGKKFKHINVTLDMHHALSIFHPIFWFTADGKHPDPFTIITSSDLVNGNFSPYHPGLFDYCKNYITSLETSGRYALCIWPMHCLIGSKGANVVPTLFAAFLDWEITNLRMVGYVSKGSNFKTEHYSAVQAEVPDPNDPSTGMNYSFIQTLEKADVIYTGGEALSHCWKNTIMDIANEFDDANIKKFVFLEDAASSVDGFQQVGEEFVQEMIQRGMQVSTTDKVML